MKAALSTKRDNFFNNDSITFENYEPEIDFEESDDSELRETLLALNEKHVQSRYRNFQKLMDLEVGQASLEGMSLSRSISNSTRSSSQSVESDNQASSSNKDIDNSALHHSKECP